MLIRRIVTVLFFLGMLFIFLHKDPQIIDGNEQGISYHIQIDDSYTMFYFQCPTIRWDVGGDLATVWINGFDYDPVYEDVWCAEQVYWEVIPDSGDAIPLTVTSRRIMMQEISGLLVLVLFIWLIIGCFRHVLQWDRLAMFSVLWALVYIMHLIGYDYARTTFWNGSPFTIVTMIAAVLLLTNPRSILFLAFLAASQLIEYWILSPYSSNHTMVIAIINLIILISLGMMLFQSRQIQFKREVFYQRFAPVIQGIVFILYFWAWFHKLNSSYVDPVASCVLDFYGQLRWNFPIFPGGDWLDRVLIYSSVVIEGGIPILLLFRRTRLLAILIGVIFHGTLGLITFRDFTGLMFAMYFTFLSVDALQHIKTLRPYFFDYIPAWLLHALWAGIIMISFIALPGVRYDLYPAIGLFANMALSACALVVVVYLLYRQYIKRDPDLLAPVLRPRSALLWIVLILLFINGTMPYVGLKTNNAYDMYSNLRVEGASNHILFPAYGQVFNYPNDLVVVEESSDPYLNDSATNGIEFVFWDFKERVYNLEPDYVLFVRGGERYLAENGNYEAVLGERAPLLLRKFMIFEPVSLNDPTQCGH